MIPLVEKQMSGWPASQALFPQLANAMDIPMLQLPELELGGPLALASLLQIGVKQALSYYET